MEAEDRRGVGDGDGDCPDAMNGVNGVNDGVGELKGVGDGSESDEVWDEETIVEELSLFLRPKCSPNPMAKPTKSIPNQNHLFCQKGSETTSLIC